MQSKLFTLVAAAALGGLLATGCSKPADTSSSAGSTDSSAAASASAAPAAGASSDAASSATTAPDTAASTSSMSASSQTVASAGDPSKGETVFAANCAGCHGEKGAGGGVGPSLKGEKSRKDTAAAIAWIKNPQPPMPKLYPSPLSETDVANVAAYVESL